MIKTNRQMQKEETRAKIVRAAYEEFGKHGILATRMCDVATAAAVSHGTVFVHFETQEVLISAVIEEYGGKIALRTHQLSDGCASIRDILTAHLNGIMEYEPFYRRIVMESPFLPPTAQSTLVSIQSAISFHLSLAFEQGIAAGTIVHTPIPLLFNTWIGLVNYYLMNENLFAPGGNVMERYGETLINHYLRLITVKPTEIL